MFSNGVVLWLVAIFAASSPISANSLDKVDGKKDIVVTFKRRPSEVLGKLNLSSRGVTTKEAQIEQHKNYVEQLEAMRSESQEKVVNFLKEKEKEIKGFKSFWVNNQLFVEGASKELADTLANFDNVKSIHQQEIFHIHQPLNEGPVTDESRLTGIRLNAMEWNIEKIRAKEAWPSEAKGVCTVGVIDTGVRSTHEAFNNVKFVGWKDAVNGEESPYDDNGHGTHVCGTIAGNTGTGVAPGFVDIMACKACSGEGICTESGITECLQFMTDKKPDVISNSWGGPGGDARYLDIIKAFQLLNIATIFSAGNSGPFCGSVGSPADYPSVISVGSTTSDDSLSDFSSRGVTESGTMAPTLCAPGSDINSAWMTSDTSYRTISGTSMAAPHVTGLYALMVAQNQKLTPEQGKTALVKSCATNVLADPQQTCGNTPFTSFPNNMYGHGRIDCANALKSLHAQNIH